uniref:Keratin n=1 Tax=Chelonoidis abingdonii TaxID=106734 RepID=A0A8C0G7H7_CHEAB
MSCSRNVCIDGGSACGVAHPRPYTDSCNQPCVTQCPGSRVIIYPPPVVVTFPGPILTTFPQESVVESVGAPVIASGYGGTSGSGAFRVGHGNRDLCGPC